MDFIVKYIYIFFASKDNLEAVFYCTNFRLFVMVSCTK